MTTDRDQKFRKKPVVIEATQWFKNGDHPDDYTRPHEVFEDGELRQFAPNERKANAWEGDIVRYYRSPEVPGERECQHCGNTMREHGWIDTLEGGHIVCPGDWIITGIKGEFYPCKPDIFASTHEPAHAREAGAQDPVAWQHRKICEYGATGWRDGRAPADLGEFSAEERPLYTHPAPAQEPVAVPAGWKLVPETPTPEMTEVGAAARWRSAIRDPDSVFEIYQAMLAASPVAPTADGGVKVRELEWMCQEHAGPESTTKWEAATEFGRYIVAWRRGGDWRYEPPTVFGGSGGYPSPKIAIVAAQADYECRILSALEPSPSGWDAGAFEAGAKAMREACVLAVDEFEPGGKRYDYGHDDASMRVAIRVAILALPLPTPPAGEG